MNPARSLAPALVADSLGDVWIYILGPLIGACLAVILTRLVHGATEGDPKSEEAAQGASDESTSPDRDPSPQRAASVQSAARPR
jgi:hypothetical protein